LSAHPEKEGSKKRKEKLKHAFLALKKKITGVRKDSSETYPSITVEDSCRNFVSLCDDSYQQNFGSANIDFGMTGSTSSSKIPAASVERVLDLIHVHGSPLPLHELSIERYSPEHKHCNVDGPPA
jgi:hypothetical protein